MGRVRVSRLAAAGTLGLIFLVLAATALAFDPLTEQRNFQKINERNQLITLTPAFQAKLQAQNVRDSADLALLLAGDPERNPLQNVCVQRKNECAGDVRFYDWGQEFGVAQPVLYTARNGATISGTIWITQEGPARRPAIVITTGSVQAPETLYWGLAATFAKHGYVVLTYDVQGQGRSDTNGEGADSQEGFPSQAGQPFYDGTEDALDFMLSSATSPYTPRPSCGNANSGTPTSHAAKQQRRVEAGLNDGFNPFASLIDPDRVGIAGHSLGAAAVSFVGQKDPRVDAIVAWDNLRAPETASACPAAPGTRTPPPITKPALGFSNDYGLTQQPFTSDPPRDRHNEAFAAYRDVGVDTMQINIRGGTHFEYSFLPGNTAPIPLGAATWRGMDLAAWYTVAWFDRYVKGGDPAALAAAESRLLTDRWCDDLPTKGIDPAADGNMFSFYFDSPVDFARAAGGRAQITDLREACGGPSLAPDGAPVPYDFLADSMRPATPGPGPAPGSGGPDSGSRFKCRATRRVRGTRRADRLRGTPRAERIRALRGADLIAARAGADCALGGRGRDRAFGGPGNDLVRGGAAADALRGSRGRDVVAGDAGRDRIRGGRGNDVLLGGGGRDRIRSRDGRVDVIACGPGADLIIADRADQRSGCERALRG